MGGRSRKRTGQVITFGTQQHCLKGYSRETPQLAPSWPVHTHAQHFAETQAHVPKALCPQPVRGVFVLKKIKFFSVPLRYDLSTAASTQLGSSQLLPELGLCTGRAHPEIQNQTS